MTQQLTNLTIAFDEIERKETLKIDFETALTEAIDEVFTTLGERVKIAIYSCLENRHGIRKDQISGVIDGFADAIELIFGDAAKLIELQIIEKLHYKVKDFNYKSNGKEMLFAEYLTALRGYLN